MERISTFGKRLAEFRALKELTFDQLADLVGIAPQTLNRYELNQRVPKVDIANDIAEKLGINPLWLQGFDVPLSQEAPEIIGAAAHFDPSKLTPEAIEEYNKYIEYLAYKYGKE